jgi:squalene-hopene/tetraprenyl-beta-curcumene cyclase
MSRRLLIASLALVAAVASIAPASRGQDLGSVIDQGLAELARRQQPNGSYANDVCVTAQAVLALAQSPRRYTESDGPFVRKAVAWLASQVGPDGRPSGSAKGDEAVAAALWMRAALATAHSEPAKAAAQKLATFLASPEGRPEPDAKPVDHLWTWQVTAGKDVADAQARVAGFLSPIVSGRAIAPNEFDRQLEALPSVLNDVVARFGDLRLQTTTGADQPWSTVVSGVVLAALRAPAGFEEASPRNLASSVRALTICGDHVPKGGGEATGRREPPKGTPRTVGSDLRAAYVETATAGLKWLEQQQKDGRFGFMGHDDPGITALALTAALRTYARLNRPRPAWIDPGLDYLVSIQNKNGSIHRNGLAVYTTSAALMALTEGGREKDQDAIARATTFLKVVQLDEAEGYDKENDWGYGGIGYDGYEMRPDLSNTQFGLEGLRDAGVPAGDEAMQRAILFLQRCQNNPEFNPKPFEREDGQIVRSGTDGGAGYAPGESKAGLVDNGDGTFTSRSYGSMTYALLKCYLFAGLKLDDPRVKAALRWIEGHWTVDANPGFDPKENPDAQFQGLFYYWFTMAKALDASGLATLTTPDGVKHAWRDELMKRLLAASMTEGFWTNSRSARWMEEFPVLASSYALIAMDHCLGKGKPGQ